MFAFHKAKEEINRNAVDRRTRQDTGRSEKEMEIGDRLYVRNRGDRGRDKIQIKWKPKVYVISEKPFHSVHTVKAENSDSGKNCKQSRNKTGYLVKYTSVHLMSNSYFFDRIFLCVFIYCTLCKLRTDK